MSTWLAPREDLPTERLLQIARDAGWRTDTSDPEEVRIWPFANDLDITEEREKLGITPTASVRVSVCPRSELVVGCTAYYMRYAPVIAVVETIHHDYGHEWWSEHEMYDEWYDSEEGQEPSPRQRD